MALISCAECSKQISDKAAACPHCGAPMTPPASSAPSEAALYAATFNKKKPESSPIAIGISALIAIFVLAKCVGSDGDSSAKSSDFDWNDALTMCQGALKRAARDPEKAEVPYVPNHGSGDEFYYAWGPSTKMARMRNGLGLEVAATASCTVSKSQKRITSLTLNGQTIL